METARVISMTAKEWKRLRVIEEVLEKKLKQDQAGRLLKISVRQVRRMVRRVKAEGAKGIIHRLRGQASNRKHADKHKEKVIALCRTQYAGFGPTLAQEKLAERNKLYVNRETLRQWMLADGLWEVSKKGQKHREWRERRACCGEMTQVDGSHHAWLERRGPALVLMGYIDDATGKAFAWFYEYEGTLPAMDSLYRYSQRYGLPHSLYLDRLSAYRGGYGKLSIEEQLAGQRKSQSQFERALDELGVEVIHAQSPQAKGRVERLFKTFQDRLVKEMRLARVKSREAANKFLGTYLPKYNRRFGVKAREAANLHRPLPAARELVQILSIQTKRVVRNDATIRHETKLYQILDATNHLKEVVVQERMDGKLYVVHAGQELPYREIQEPPKHRQHVPQKRAPLKTKPAIPAMSHPWKGPNFRQVQGRKAMAAAA